jgi:hypothetical protein
MKSKVKKAGQIYHALLRAIDVAPVIIPVIVMSFAISAVVFLLADSYKAEYIIPAGTLLSVLMSYVVIRYTPQSVLTKERNVSNTLVLIGVMGWLIFNGLLTPQHLFIDRDPAIYTNGAIWLTENDSLRPPVLRELDGIGGVRSNANGFDFSVSDPDELYAQGLHVLPALLALGGRIFGVSAMLHMNVLFGASALLAVYAAARIFIAPRWSLLAPAIMSVSMPFIYFSRDTYGEPLAATFTFGVLALVGSALQSKNILPWLIAGLMLGAGTMTRIDGFLTIAAMMGFVLLSMAMAERGLERRLALKTGFMFVLGTSITAAISMADLLILSKGYYLSQQGLMRKEFVLIGAVAAVGALFVWLSWRTSIVKKLDVATSGRRPYVLAGALVAGTLLLMTRPLWFTGYLFAREGVREANTVRSFSEYSTYWVSWYVGEVIFLLGILGVAYAAFRVMKTWRPYVMALFAVTATTMIVYFLMPSIYPDQIWASRRMLPVIMPGLVLFGVYLASVLTDRMQLSRVHSGAAYIVVSCFLVVTPLLISKPILNNRDVMQLGLIQEVCTNISNDTLVVWPTRLSGKLIMPTRGMCGVSSYGYGTIETLTRDNLKLIAKKASEAEKTAILGIDTKTLEALSQEVLNDTRIKPTASYSYLELERRHIGAPQTTIPISGKIYLLEVTNAGTLKAS